MFREGTSLEALESVDSRRYLPHAVAATLVTIVAPALVVVALSPLSGAADVVLSALIATGLSVVAGSAGAALWTRLPQSREIPFGDLMLWSFARRVRAERKLARIGDTGPVAELGVLRTLAVVFEARDGSSHGHSGRVARHAERVARRMGLPPEEVDRIEAAAAVHDVGMLGVPRAILSKPPAERSPEESALVERHGAAGAERVGPVACPDTAAIVRHHHERYDGAGYPDGLAGEAIPLGARIVAVADRFDELVASGPGEARGGRRNALDELRAGAGSEFDPAVVAAFAAYYSSARSIAGVALAATAPQRAVRWLAAAPGATIGAASAPVALQSMCAGGAAALAGACLVALPATPPDRGAERASADGRAAAGESARGTTELAATAPGAAAGLGARGPRRGGRQDGERGGNGGRRDGGGEAPVSNPPRAPAAPSPGAGSPAPGGGGDGARPGGDGGGAAPPPARAPATPPTPTTPNPAPHAPNAPQPPANPVSQVVDPVLDGVGEAVPPVKPVTDTLKGIVGGLLGGGR